MVFGVVLILGSLLAGCFGDTATTTTDEEVLTLSDLKECGYTFREGIYVTCEDEGPTLEFVRGSPPEGWTCSYRPGEGSPYWLLWNPVQQRYGVQVLSFTPVMRPQVGSVDVVQDGKSATFHWNSDGGDGHVLLPSGSPAPADPLEPFSFSLKLQEFDRGNASDPLRNGPISVIWSKGESNAHPTLLAEPEDERYYFPMGKNERSLPDIGLALPLDGKDFEYNLTVRTLWTIIDQSTMVFPPSFSCASETCRGLTYPLCYPRSY